MTNSSSSFVQLQVFGAIFPPHGHVTHRGSAGDGVENFDLIKGKQHAYRIKQVYPKYTTKTFHRVGLAVPISHTA